MCGGWRSNVIITFILIELIVEKQIMSSQGNLAIVFNTYDEKVSISVERKESKRWRLVPVGG